jgi:hypothetical protein
MRKTLLWLGGLGAALWASSDAAEAKLVRYEINGQSYSYSTRNRQQTLEARQRIEAAQTAANAKAQADAERAANPLAGVFGSPTQANAAAAQARAQQALAQPQTQPAGVQPARVAAETTGSVRSRAERRRAVAETQAERRRAQAEARAERARARREARAERRSRQAAEAAPKPATADRGVAPEPARERFAAAEPGAPAAPAPPAQPASEAVAPKPGPKPAVKSVSFDLSSGIKTTHMMDGSVHEEPIDSGTVSKLSAEPPGGSLTGFVDQVRKPAKPQ